VAGGSKEVTRLRRRPLVAAAVALAAVYVIWGSTYLAIAVAVESLPPLLLLSLRFLLAGGALYAWSVRRGERPGPRQWRAAVVVGGLLLFVDTGAVAWALQRNLDTSLVALLCATVPLWMVGLDAGLSGRRLSRATVAGIGVGLLGVALLVGPSAAGLDLVAVAAVLGGAIAWAAGSLYARRASLHLRRDLSAGMEMLAAGVLLGVAAAVTGEGSDVHVPSAAAIAAIAYLVVFGSLVAYTAYGWLLAHVPTKVVATHGYVNPVVAVALGCLLLGEPLTATTFAAGALVVLSVVLIVGLPKRERRLEPIPSTVRLPVPARSAFSRLAA